MAFNLSAAINLQAPSTAQVNKAIQSITYSFDKAEKKAQSFSDIISLKTTNFAAYAVASAAVLKFTNAISQATVEAIRLEKEVVKITQVIGVSVKSSKALTSAILQISQSYGISSVKVAETVRTLTQSGIAFDKARKAAELLAKTTLLATFDSLQSTTEGLVAIFAQFNLSVKDAEIAIGSINALSKRYAVESGDLIEAVKRAGGVFSATGGKLEDLLAIFTTVRSTTRESAETIATGLRTIFSRLQRPKTIEYFRELGIELTNLKGQFVGNLPAVQKISDGIAALGIRAGDIKFAEIVEQLGGIRQAARVIPLLTQQAKLADTVAVANKGLVETDEDVAKAKQTLAFRIDELRAKFSALVTEVAESSVFKVLTGTMVGLADSLISVTSSLKPLLPLLIAFAGIKIGQGIAKGIKGIGSGSLNILGFNRGGVVPGSGNGDTVPSMLEPGEFVIRKSAVQAFGADKLASINKYANGSEVLKERQALVSDTDFDPYSTESKIQSNKLRTISDNYSITGAELQTIAENKKLNPAAIGGLRGIIFETAIKDKLGVNIDAGFPDVQKKDLKKIGGNFVNKNYDGAELKYTNNENTRSSYYDRYFGTNSVGKKIPMVYGYAKGGSVGTDTIPALLTPGEFVINKKSAQAAGYSNLQKINKYAKGGIVGPQKFADGGAAEQSFSRSGGTSVDLKAANVIADKFIKGLGDFSKEFLIGFDNTIKDIKEFEQSVKEQIQQAKQSGQDSSKLEKILVKLQTSKGVQSTSKSGSKIGIRLGSATGRTVRHELGHQADTAIGRQAGFSGKASMESGSFQAKVAEKIKPLLEEYLKKTKHSNQYITYRLKNEEIFADLMSKATPEVRKILVSTVDAKEGMKLLAEVISQNANAARGFGGLTAADFGTPQNNTGGQNNAQSKTKSKATAFLFSSLNNTVKKVISTMSLLPNALTGVLSAAGPLAIGLSALVKGFGDAESKLAKRLDAFGGEFFKFSALISGATAAGSIVGPKGTEEQIKAAKEANPKIEKFANSLGNLTIAAATAYKAWTDSRYAIELETASRLKQIAVEKGNVQEAVNQARAQVEISQDKTASDIATPIFAGIGSVIGGVVAQMTNSLIPGLGLILAGPLSKIGSSIGVFLSTFKPVVDLMVSGIDGLISMTNSVIEWFGGDPFPTLTETFEKEKALQIEKAKSDAIFNRSVLRFERSQREIESSLSAASSGPGAGSGDIARTQQLLASKLELANKSIDDFSAQLTNEINKVGGGDSSRRQELNTKLSETLNYFEEGLGETTQFLRNQGKSVKESLEAVGASFDANNNIILTNNKYSNDLVAAYKRQLGNQKDAEAATLAFYRSLVPATIAVKANADIFEQLSKVSRALVKSRLQGVDNFAQFRANVRQTPIDQKQSSLESREVLNVSNSIAGISGPIKNVGDLLNEMSTAADQVIQADRAYADTDERSRETLLAGVTAAKDKFENLTQVSQNLINSMQQQLEVAGRAASQLYDLELAFAFGTREEKKRLNKDLSLARRVAEGGTGAVANKELPNVLRTLDQLSEIEVAPGKTGRQVKEDVLVAQRTQLKRQITGDSNARLSAQEEALVRAQSTPEIERIAKDILKTQEAERKARDSINQAEVENNKLFAQATQKLKEAAEQLAKGEDIVLPEEPAPAKAPVKFGQAKQSNRFELEQRALELNTLAQPITSPKKKGRGGSGFQAMKLAQEREKNKLKLEQEAKKIAQELVVTKDDRARAGLNTKGKLTSDQIKSQERFVRDNFANDLMKVAQTGRTSEKGLQNGGIDRRELERQQQQAIANKYANSNSMRPPEPKPNNKPVNNTSGTTDNNPSVSVNQAFAPIEVIANVIHDPKITEEARKQALLASSRKLDEMSQNQSMGAPQFA